MWAWTYRKIVWMFMCACRGETFAVARNGEGLEALVARVKALRPALIGVEAMGGFETMVVAALGGAGQLVHFASHQPLGGEGEHVANKIVVRPLVNQVK